MYDRVEPRGPKPLVDWITHDRAFWTELSMDFDLPHPPEKVWRAPRLDHHGRKALRAAREAFMSRRVRQFHRGSSMLFMLTVIPNFIAMASGTPPAWVTCAALPPLFLSRLSGAYLSVLPHVAGRHPAQE